MYTFKVVSDIEDAELLHHAGLLWFSRLHGASKYRDDWELQNNVRQYSPKEMQEQGDAVPHNGGWLHSDGDMYYYAIRTEDASPTPECDSTTERSEEQ